MDADKEEIKPMKFKENQCLQHIPTTAKKRQTTLRIKNNEINTNHTTFQTPSDIVTARSKVRGLERFPSLQNIREICYSNKIEPSNNVSEAQEECRHPRSNRFPKCKYNVSSWVSFESKDGLRLKEVPDGSAQFNLDKQPNEMLKHLVSIADSITYNGLELQDPSGKMHHYFDAYLPPYLEDEAA